MIVFNDEFQQKEVRECGINILGVIQIPSLKINGEYTHSSKVFRGKKVIKFFGTSISNLNFIKEEYFENDIILKCKNVELRKLFRVYIRRTKENTTRIFLNKKDCKNACLDNDICLNFEECVGLSFGLYEKIIHILPQNAKDCFKVIKKPYIVASRGKKMKYEQNRIFPHICEKNVSCSICVSIKSIFDRINFGISKKRLKRTKYGVNELCRILNVVFNEKELISKFSSQVLDNTGTKSKNEVLQNKKHITVVETEEVSKMDCEDDFPEKLSEGKSKIKDRKTISHPLPRVKPSSRLRFHTKNFVNVGRNSFLFDIDKEKEKQIGKILEDKKPDKPKSYKLRKKSNNRKTKYSRKKRLNKQFKGSGLFYNTLKDNAEIFGEKTVFNIEYVNTDPLITNYFEREDEIERMKKKQGTMDALGLSKRAFIMGERNKGEKINVKLFDEVLEEKNQFIQCNLLSTKNATVVTNFVDVFSTIRKIFIEKGVIREDKILNSKLKKLAILCIDSRPFKQISNLGGVVRYADVSSELFQSNLVLWPLLFGNLTDKGENIAKINFQSYGTIDNFLNSEEMKTCIQGDESFICGFIGCGEPNNPSKVNSGQCFLLMKKMAAEDGIVLKEMENAKKNCWECFGEDFFCLFNMPFPEIVFKFRENPNKKLSIWDIMKIKTDYMHSEKNCLYHCNGAYTKLFIQCDRVYATNGALVQQLKYVMKKILGCDWEPVVVVNNKTKKIEITIPPIYPDSNSELLAENYSKVTSVLNIIDHNFITAVFEENPFEVKYDQYLTSFDKDVYSSILKFKNKLILWEELPKTLIEKIKQAIKNKKKYVYDKGDLVYSIKEDTIVRIKCFENSKIYSYFFMEKSLQKFGELIEQLHNIEKLDLVNSFNDHCMIDVISKKLDCIRIYGLNLHFPSIHKKLKHRLKFYLFDHCYRYLQMQGPERANIEHFKMYEACKCGYCDGKNCFERMFAVLIRKMHDYYHGYRNDFNKYQRIIDITDGLAFKGNILQKLIYITFSIKEMLEYLKEMNINYVHKDKLDLVKYFSAFVQNGKIIDFRLIPFDGDFLMHKKVNFDSVAAKFYTEIKANRLFKKIKQDTNNKEKIFIKIE